jgi:hypothetical protein
MIEYYLRPDGAYMKIDKENKIITNVLSAGHHKFIGNNTDQAYVDNMIAMAGSFHQCSKADYYIALEDAKSFINNLN